MPERITGRPDPADSVTSPDPPDRSPIEAAPTMRLLSPAEQHEAEARYLQRQAEALNGEIDQLTAQSQKDEARWQALRSAPTLSPPDARQAEDLQRAILVTRRDIARLRQQYITLLNQAHEHYRLAASLGHLGSTS